MSFLLFMGLSTIVKSVKILSMGVHPVHAHKDSIWIEHRNDKECKHPP